jgi:glycosyltransferase involved in cell wall biosynthesis
MSPKISFVVPTKNRVEWLPECLGGLLAQSIQDIEVIVVNDGSDDGTKELLEDHFSVDPRIKVINNSVSKGAGMARNQGNSIAQAPIIGVCDDDDVYPTDRADRILKFFEKYPEGMMMTAPYVQIGYNNQIMEAFDGLAFDEEDFKKNGNINYFCHPAAAYTLKDINEVGGYKPETDQLTDDVQLVKDWIMAGKKIGFMAGEYLCCHRVLPDSMMVKHRGFNPAWATK